MTKAWHLLAIILAPLIAGIGVAFAVYGVEGPPDTARVNEAMRLFGMGYGAYVVAAGFYWWKQRREVR